MSRHERLVHTMLRGRSDANIHFKDLRATMRYEIILYWSNEDQLFVAEAPELPGCMADGDDQETALRNIKDAMQFWIDRARELGRTGPEPKTSSKEMPRSR